VVIWIVKINFHISLLASYEPIDSASFGFPLTVKSHVFHPARRGHTLWMPPSPRYPSGRLGVGIETETLYQIHYP